MGKNARLFPPKADNPVMLCPIRGMQPCAENCAWKEGSLCSVRLIAQELYYTADALQALAGNAAPSKEGE